MRIEIPETEFEIFFSRSSGAGGQNVNKVNTKAYLRWNLWNSKVLAPEQKEIAAQVLKNKLDTHGDIILYSQEYRAQYQNKKSVIEKLNNLINLALKPVKKRIASKPTRSSQEKRIKEKKIKSEKKRLRNKAEIDKF